MIEATFIPMQPPPRYGGYYVHPASELACLVWEIFGFKPSVN